MLKFFKNLLFISLPTVVLFFLLLELFFRFMIPGCQRPSVAWNERYDLVQFDTIPRNGLFTIGKFAQQQGKWHINNHQWNNSIDYQKEKLRPRIAVIGDSYVEAFQVNIRDSFHEILRDSILNHEVYSFGTSGAPLSHYLHMARYVNQEFNPDIFVFSIIHNDFDESISQLRTGKEIYMTLDIQKDTIVEIKPKAPFLTGRKRKLKMLFKKSAFIRYLYVNLKIEQLIHGFLKNQSHFQNNTTPDYLIKNVTLIDQGIYYVLSKIRREFYNKRIIFLMDAPRYEIYNGDLVPSKVKFLHTMMATYCQKFEFEWLDLTNPFFEDYQKNSIPFNSDLDRHWNKYGHQKVAEILSLHLKKG